MTISNQQFLKTMFGDGHILKAALKSTPSSTWETHSVSSSTDMEAWEKSCGFEHTCAYYSIASFKDASADRVYDNWHAMHVLVLDDVCTKGTGITLTPTASIETSKDNYQHVFKLDKPLTDLARAKRLCKTLENFGDKAGNHAHRLARLPVGSNVKPEKYGFKNVLEQWNPDVTYTVEQLETAFKVNLGVEMKPVLPKTSDVLFSMNDDDLQKAIHHFNVIKKAGDGERNEMTHKFAMQLGDWGASAEQAIYILSESQPYNPEYPIGEITNTTRSAYKGRETPVGCRHQDALSSKAQRIFGDTYIPDPVSVADETPLIHFTELDKAGWSLGALATSNHGENASHILRDKYNSRLHVACGEFRYWNDKYFEYVNDDDVERSITQSLMGTAHSKSGILSGTYIFINKSAPKLKDINPVSRKVFLSNGFVDLARPLEGLQPHTPTNRNGHMFAWKYLENAPLPVEWMGFLHSVFEGDEDLIDKINSIQEFLGWSLISDNLNIQKAVVLRGASRSGKGTILKVLHNLYGESTGIANLKNLGGLIEDKVLNSMLSANIAIDHDAKSVNSRDAKEVVGVINKITANEPVTVKQLWTNKALDITMNCKLAFACNSLPTLIDDTGAIVGRYHQIMFNHSFLGREDFELPGKLSQETALIGSWAIEGLKRLIANGRFTTPSSTTQAAEDANENSQPLTLFIEECTNLGGDEKAHTSELYSSWVRWCIVNGERQSTRKQFITSLDDTLRSKGISRSKGIRIGEIIKQGFIGISVKPLKFGDNVTQLNRM